MILNQGIKVKVKTSAKKTLNKINKLINSLIFLGMVENILFPKNEVQIYKNNHRTMFLMSKQVFLPKISLILQKMKTGPKSNNFIIIIIIPFLYESLSSYYNLLFFLFPSRFLHW